MHVNYTTKRLWEVKFFDVQLICKFHVLKRRKFSLSLIDISRKRIVHGSRSKTPRISSKSNILPIICLQNCKDSSRKRNWRYCRLFCKTGSTLSRIQKYSNTPASPQFKQHLYPYKSVSSKVNNNKQYGRRIRAE